MQSGIVGRGTAIFGGKIGTAILRRTSERPSIAIGFEELREVGEIGIMPKANNRSGDFKIQLIFQSLESIDVVQDALTKARNKLSSELNSRR